MSEAPDSLGPVGAPPSGGSEPPMTESKPMKLGGPDAPPEFDRVADVLGPLEQIVLAADQKLGTIQQQVSSEAGESAAEVDRRVRQSALEQRQRVAELRGELTQRVTELAGRFDALLSVLDQADQQLAGFAGEPADVSVTVTERQRVQISHEAQQAAAPGAPSGAPPGAPPGAVPPARDAKAAKRAEKEAARRAAKEAKAQAKAQKQAQAQAQAQPAAGKPSMADQSPIVRTVRKLFGGRSKDASA